ncbi:DUF6683 family protein [Hymenobacter ruricola]|uniref:Uncharacterized protein n=1 Tax=Hymenobacter ruricola TaxID=2791023 RepID=A0ABS0I2U5_9BACT|nr:DUF6683 family protein [Hymenobacter ruricola]MBF9221283.1 hypothetical protein [Hymenobacter ruricola]
MQKRFVFLGSGLLAVLLASPAARAQDGAVDLTGMGIYASEEAVNEAARESAPARGKARPVAAGAFSYVPSAALRQQTVRNAAQRLQAHQPTEAQALESAFGPGKTDYNQVYEGIIKGSGLRNNDAADALAAYILVSWMVVNNVQDGNAITVPMARGVRAQVAPLLAPKLATSGAAAQTGEGFKLQTALLFSGWQAAIKGGQLPGFRQGVASSFKSQYGFDLAPLKLTGQGLVKR